MSTKPLFLLLATCMLVSACGIAKRLTGRDPTEKRDRQLIQAQSTDEAVLRRCIIDNALSASSTGHDPNSAALSGVNACKATVDQFNRSTLYAYEARLRLYREPHPSDAVERADKEATHKIDEMRNAAIQQVTEKQSAILAAKQQEQETLQTLHGQGTAFAVNADGLYLTSEHVVARARKITITCADNEPREATVTSRSQNTDLALLHITSRTPDYLSLAPLRTARTGQHVFTIGFPLTSILGPEPKFTDGAISALSGINGEQSLLQISVPVQPGNSGGPLINDRGEVVGIVAAQAAVLTFMRNTGTLPQNVNWAIKSDYAAAMFDSPPKKPIATSISAAIDSARRATCLVDVWGNTN